MRCELLQLPCSSPLDEESLPKVRSYEELKSYAINMLKELGMIKRGKFVLSSGKVSDVYVDLREVWAYHRLARLISLMLAKEIKERFEYATLVGIATGGVPLASFLSMILGWPLGYVRLTKKGHGMDRLVEAVGRGERVIVVDDVKTTGNSINKAVDILTESGAEVLAAAVILDREEGEAKVDVISVLSLRDLT